MPYPPPGNLPNPGTEPMSPASPALPGGFFTMSTSWEALRNVQFSSVAQSCPILCDPMYCSNLASLSITNSQSLLKLMSIESMMPSNHLILCRPLFLLPSIFPPSGSFPMSLQWGWGYLSQSLNCVSSSPPQQLWGGDGAIYLSP